MLFVILILGFSLIACERAEVVEEVQEYEEEHQEEYQEEAREITVEMAAQILIQRILTGAECEDFNRYFYDAHNIEREMVARFEEYLVPSSSRDDVYGDNLERFTSNILYALGTRTSFEVTDVEELGENTYNVTLDIYGLDYDHLDELALESAFYSLMMQAMIGITALEEGGDLFEDLDLDSFKSTADYLVTMSESVRTTPISKEVVIGLSYRDGYWHLDKMEDISNITQAFLMERGYVLESDEQLQRRNGEPDSILVQRLTSASMREFEEINAVSREQERYLAFGAFLMTSNQESARILAIGNSAAHASRILRDSWNIRNGEEALEQMRALATGRGQALVANEIWLEVIVNQNVTQDDIWDGEAFEILPYTTSATRRNALEILENAMEDEELLEFLDDEYYLQGRSVEEYVYEIAKVLALEERVVAGLEAFHFASEMLTELFGFSQEELFNIETLVAWDYGRVAIVARYAVSADLLDEEDVWPYLQEAANAAERTYSSWREYTAAHILGRAIAFGNDSSDFIYTLDFLLNHSESPFQRHEFRER